MNKKKIFAMLLSGMSMLPATAQSDWFVQVDGGVQTIYSTDAQHLDFGKRLTPLLGVGFGKWINPIYALRLKVEGYSLNGFTTPQGLYLRDPQTDGTIYGTIDPVTGHVTVNPDGSYRHYLRYVNAHADLMVSLSGLFFGRQGRFDLVPSVGLGYAHAFAYRGTAHTNSLTANFGLTATYRPTKWLDVNLGASSALMPDHFDGRITGRQYEPTLGLTLGVAVRFGSGKAASNVKERTKPCHRRGAVVDTVYMVQKVIERPVYQERVVERPVAKKAEPFRLASVNFGYASARPLANQETNIANIVDYLKKNPSARIRIDGYADKATGSARTNLMLSIRRTDYLRNLLVEKYDISPSRIDAQGIGANAQPYETDALNRVVIVTALPE